MAWLGVVTGSGDAESRTGLGCHKALVTRLFKGATVVRVVHAYSTMTLSATLQAFSKSLGMIFASEIGDKTFFIAAVMAMRNPRGTVLMGCLSALALMTILSAALGWATPALLSKTYTHWASTILFFYFGFRSLYDVFFKKEEEGESELEEVERELEASNGKQSADDKKKSVGLSRVLSPILLKAFTLTFLAEWGDRSQIATIGLAASNDVFGVAMGGIIGHAFCTGAAVLGGKHLATHIDERTIAILGGLMFLVFGALAVYEGPGE